MASEHVREPQRDPQAEAQAEFAGALEILSSQFDAMVQNFGWCAAQIAGDPDASAQMHGKMKFVLQYREFGMEKAQQALDAGSGIRVDIATPDTARPGILVGIVGARYYGDRRIFDGVAVMKNSQGQEAFVKVLVRPDGSIFLAQQGDQFDYPETKGLMRDLHPKRR